MKSGSLLPIAAAPTIFAESLWPAKLRTIINVPGGMWLEDIRNGVALTVTQRHTQGIRGIPPGGKEEHELGWFGWSYFRDISRDGKKVLFEEQADGGGPNYTSISARYRRVASGAHRRRRRPGDFTRQQMGDHETHIRADS